MDSHRWSLGRGRRGVVVAVVALLGLLGALYAPVSAQVVTASDADLEITRHEVVADGQRFGRTGAYEKLVGTIAFEVDPDDPRNAVIVDLDKAPRNDAGMVEYDTDFYLLRPVDMRRWNGKLFFEVNNRGNKITSLIGGPSGNDPTTQEDFSPGFLLNEGWAVAWAGWEGDVLPGNNRMTIRLPVPTEEDGSPITQKILVEFHNRNFGESGEVECLPLSGSADFASYPADADSMDEAALRARPSDSPRPPSSEIPEGDVVPADAWRFASDTEICVDGGFDPSLVYELEYTARDPRVMGLGYAATRDVVSFLRHADQDADGDPNPLAVRGDITHALGLGISSSGMYMRDFLYHGFNEDLGGQPVFDAVDIHIPGAHKLFLNYRFAQPNPFSTQHRDRYMPYTGFPFNYRVRINPLVADGTMEGPISDGILKRPNSDPLVFHTDSSTEYWQFQAGLVNTDGFGNDIPLPTNVRQYLLSSTQHGSTGAPPVALPRCQQLSNATDYRPSMRALIVALDEWMVDGREPPASRRPSVADGTLVPSDQASTGFPAIPGVAYNGLYNAGGERDFGPRVSQNQGIIDNWRHATVLQEYEVLVAKVDALGIDVAGVKSPGVAVPTATYTGWNLRRAPFTEGDLCGLSGMTVPLHETRAEAQAAGDPRPSLEELYGSHQGYVRAVQEATRELERQRLLLREDARAAVQAARDSYILR